jgi:nicotinic acid mononucleotide adenylyltransferase
MGHFSAISQMLEEYDKVIVFPYPKKHINGVVEILPPLKQRMKMLEIFIAEHFPQMPKRLILNDLATDMGLKDKKDEGILHTYDYLQFVKEKIPSDTVLSVCLGFEAKLCENETFFRQEEIEREFGVFRLEEETKIKSEYLREFFSNHKNIKNAKIEQYIRSVVGDALAEHIFKENLYGIKKKTNIMENKVSKKKINP